MNTQTPIGHITPGQLQAVTLWERLALMKQMLEPVQTELRVVFEDQQRPDEPAKILVPDPNWMALAMRGHIVPTIDAYLNLPLIQIYKKCGVEFPFHVLGIHAAAKRWDMDRQGYKYIGETVEKTHTLHSARTLPPMSEEQAIEYLLMMNVPFHVWGDRQSNRLRFKICHVNQVPSDRLFRNTWEMIQ